MKLVETNINIKIKTFVSAEGKCRIIEVFQKILELAYVPDVIEISEVKEGN